jgi:aryl-alcohol dehydrogenase-like predicted oxidoreductase
MSSPLPRRPLGSTGLRVSPLGLAGSYGIEASAVERAFHDFGINYFFVSPRMSGLCEGLRRLIRKGHRDELVIAGGAGIPLGFTVKSAWDKLARELGVDCIDVFHLFWVQAHWYVTGKTWPAFVRLKEEGKARALAISCHDRPMARTLVDELSLDVLMIRYNAAHRGAESEIFATLPTRDAAVASSGAPDPRAVNGASAEVRRRTGIVSYTATRWGRLLKPAGELAAMTGPECYRFALGHPSVDVVLCGASTLGELRENVEGVRSGPIPEERMEQIRRFGDAVRATARGRIGFMGV